MKVSKILKVVCIGIVAIFVLLVGIGAIFGNKEARNTTQVSDVTNEVIKENNLIIDANQFSGITSEELVNLMGKPDSLSDYEWKVPSTGQSIIGKLYIYEQNKFEFILFDDSVVRLNVYSGEYWGYDDSVLEFENKDHILSLFNIDPNNNLKKIGDTNYALRYSPVSDKVADIWIQEINEKTFGIAKITYNLNYF